MGGERIQVRVRMSASCILDSFGRPAQSVGLYRTPSSNPAATRLKPQLRQRSYENVSPWQRRDLINWCWGIYGKITNVSAAVDTKTSFACSDGCYTQYYGQNKDWGKAMMASINGPFYRNCNLLGENHDFHASLAELSTAIETHGQVGWVFDSVEGKFKFISANSIGNGMSPDSKSGAVYELGKADASLSYWGLATCSGGFSNLLKIERGPFAGNFIIDGIIVNRSMKHLATRVLGFNEAGEASHADLPVGVLNLVYEPKFTDQIMGYPGLADIVEAVGTVDDWNHYIGQAMKLSAAFAVTRKSKDGKPSANARRVQLDEEVDDGLGGTARNVRVMAHEIVQAGLVELATDNNEEIGSVPFDRPSMNEEAFIARIETGIFAKHCPREFIYTDGAGRAAARISVIRFRQNVWNRHKTLARFGAAVVQRRIAWEMQRGLLPKNQDLADPYLIQISTPAEASVDEGNDAKIDLAKLGRGATSHRIICAKDGRDEETVDEDNFSTLTRRMARAKEIHASKENQGPDGEPPILTIKEILQRIDNGGNPNQQLDLTEPGPEDTTTKQNKAANNDTTPTSPPKA